jgi:hypothetical protein
MATASPSIGTSRSVVVAPLFRLARPAVGTGGTGVGVSVVVVVVAVWVVDVVIGAAVAVAVVAVVIKRELILVASLLVEVRVQVEVAVVTVEVVEVTAVTADVFVFVFIRVVFMVAGMVAWGWKNSARWAAFLRKHWAPYLQGSRGRSCSLALGKGVPTGVVGGGTSAWGMVLFSVRSVDTLGLGPGTGGPTVPVLGLKNEVIIKGPNVSTVDSISTVSVQCQYSDSTVSGQCHYRLSTFDSHSVSTVSGQSV